MNKNISKSKIIKIMIGIVVCIAIAATANYTVKAVKETENKNFISEAAKIDIRVFVKRSSKTENDHIFTVINHSKYPVEVLCIENNDDEINFPLCNSGIGDGFGPTPFDKINSSETPYTNESVCDYHSEASAQKAYDEYKTKGVRFRIFRSDENIEDSDYHQVYYETDTIYAEEAE